MDDEDFSEDLAALGAVEALPGRARRDGRASHVATDGDAAMVCLDAGRRRLW